MISEKLSLMLLKILLKLYCFGVSSLQNICCLCVSGLWIKLFPEIINQDRINFLEFFYCVLVFKICLVPVGFCYKLVFYFVIWSFIIIKTRTKVSKIFSLCSLVNRVLFSLNELLYSSIFVFLFLGGNKCTSFFFFELVYLSLMFL